MARIYPHIIGPKEGHAHQRVTSPDTYLAAQAKHLAMNRAAGADDAVPHEATAEERAQASAPYINSRQWLMTCACGNAPSVSVDWDLACCFECGAIYRGLTSPEDRATIEAVLVKRKPRARNSAPPETRADLIAQNRANGDEVPDAL